MALETGEIKVTTNGKFVRAIPAEFIPVPLGRGSPVGMTDDGALYAAFATEGPRTRKHLIAFYGWRAKLVGEAARLVAVFQPYCRARFDGIPLLGQSLGDAKPIVRGFEKRCPVVGIRAGRSGSGKGVLYYPQRRWRRNVERSHKTRQVALFICRQLLK